MGCHGAPQLGSRYRQRTKNDAAHSEGSCRTNCITEPKRKVRCLSLLLKRYCFTQIKRMYGRELVYLKYKGTKFRWIVVLICEICVNSSKMALEYKNRINESLWNLKKSIRYNYTLKKKKQLRTTAGNRLARLISENSVGRTAKYFSWASLPIKRWIWT